MPISSCCIGTCRYIDLNFIYILVTFSLRSTDVCFSSCHSHDQYSRSCDVVISSVLLLAGGINQRPAGSVRGRLHSLATSLICRTTAFTKDYWAKLFETFRREDFGNIFGSRGWSYFFIVWCHLKFWNTLACMLALCSWPCCILMSLFLQLKDR